MSDRLKTYIKLCSAALFLLLCALLPLSFINTEAQPDGPDEPQTTYSPTSFIARATIFGRYLAGILPTESFSETVLTESEIAGCWKKLTQIQYAFKVDLVDDIDILNNGVNLFTVTDDDGSQLRLAEYYMEWYGDWKNWIKIVIDVDTLDLYQVYVSSSCLSNFDLYLDESLSNDLDNYLADLCIKAGLDLFQFDIAQPSDINGVGSWIAVCRVGDELVNYKIDGQLYVDSVTPSLLVDLNISCGFAENVETVEYSSSW